MSVILLTLIIAFATIFVQVLCFSVLHLGDVINHPLLYLGLGGTVVLLWAFAAESP
ncbi:MAG: hypothetical protein ACO3EZ_00470 [Prochlorotrichaceae cyanobacterium]